MWLIRSTHSAMLRVGYAQDRFLVVFLCFLVFFVENGEFLLNSVGFLAFLRDNI